MSGLTYFKGTFYGTTDEGGVYGCSSVGIGCGTVYSITPSGRETVLHTFTGGKDGSEPDARMIVRNGTLYGTTTDGVGVYHGGGCGTVFSITPSGHETVLHEFTCSPDGSNPIARLLNVNGTFYGTTYHGGSHDNGTVFSIAPGGKEKVVYSFGARRIDGAEPAAGLIDVKGTLYGTTAFGGASSTYYGSSGTVFTISPSGKEKVLHNFGIGKDGIEPFAGLIDVKGTLYGTTSEGGSGSCRDGYVLGCGTVFSITPGGKEKVLFSFSGPDGNGPDATLLDVNGTLYGTTQNGGAYGYGTVFSITRSGYETVLYSFKGGQDGEDPQSGLSYVNGTFYGTTPFGGAGGGAYSNGTVYSVTL
jgi:uncharacterized repeat protein (TIGR03803 family)